jgi:hypothetical protein
MIAQDGRELLGSRSTIGIGTFTQLHGTFSIPNCRDSRDKASYQEDWDENLCHRLHDSQRRSLVAKALMERMLIACVLGMLLNAGSKGSSNIIANEQAAR